jgi:hypothetical protein
MEALETDDMPMEAKAVRLGDLQQEWKDLDRGGAPANQKLWRRFHAASEQVYEHCRPYFEEQAKQRRAARAQREDVCRQLEGFLEHVDWDRVDWKQAVRAEREMRRGWAALGEVEGRHQRGLERRFHAAIKRLHERLAAERSHNQAFKSDLIERVEALVESPELDDAIEETKRLQRMWRTTVPARQRDENRLWQRFRTACDAVFARRRQQHEAFAAELDEHLGQREALCAEAEALAASDGDPAALSQAFHRIEERWGETESLPVPNRAAAALNQRWREARRGVLRKERELAAQARRAALSLLARQATVCESLERALESGSLTGDRVAAAQAAWRELPRQTDADLQRRMESRFRAAVAALGSDGDALRTALPDNATRRAELCLHLEILAQVDSPPETNQARLAFQVDRLKGHMRAGEKDPLGDASRLLEDWYLCGPAPAAVAPGLERRFQRALSALEQGEGEIGLHDA